MGARTRVKVCEDSFYGWYVYAVKTAQRYLTRNGWSVMCTHGWFESRDECVAMLNKMVGVNKWEDVNCPEPMQDMIDLVKECEDDNR